MFSLNYINEEGKLCLKEESNIEDALDLTSKVHKPLSISEFNSQGRIVSIISSKIIYNLMKGEKSNTSNHNRHVTCPHNRDQQLS